MIRPRRVLFRVLGLLIVLLDVRNFHNSSLFCGLRDCKRRLKACRSRHLALALATGKVVPIIHRRGPWRSFDAVEYATLEWVDWFNNRRLLEPIGNIPPAEAEARYYAQIDVFDIAA
jgi:transposase InsO family protein